MKRAVRVVSRKEIVVNHLGGAGVLYLNKFMQEKKQATKSFWSKFFTESIDEEATSVDSLIVSVASQWSWKYHDF